MNIQIVTRNGTDRVYDLLSNWALEHDTTAEEILKSQAEWKLCCYVLWVGIFCMFLSVIGMTGLMSDIAQGNSAGWYAIMIVGLGATSVASCLLFTSDRRFVAFNEDYKKLCLAIPYIFSPMNHPSVHDIARTLTEIVNENDANLHLHNLNLLGPDAEQYESEQYTAAAKARTEEMQEAQRLLRVFCRVHT